MFHKCFSSQTISAQLVHLSLEIAPYDIDDVRYEAGTPFQCQLSNGEHDMHGSFLRKIPGREDEVWFLWDEEGLHVQVSVRSPCNKPYPEDADACMMYSGHSGKCDWEIELDLEATISAGLDQVEAGLREILERGGY